VKRRPAKKFYILKAYRIKDMLFKNFFQTSTILMKRKVFEATGFLTIHILWRRKTLSFAGIHYILLRADEVNLINYGNGKRGFGQSGLSGILYKWDG